MNRIIKFRAWINNSSMIFLTATAFGDIIDNHNKKDYKIMQFTGLKDKNGKDIYEGDIIEWFADGINKRGYIIYENDGWYIIRTDKKIYRPEDKYYPFQSFMFIQQHELDGEVIGNIYENKELKFAKCEQDVNCVLEE